MTEAEIQISPDGKTYEPCSVCMEIILDTAYSDGFVKEDPLDDPEIEDEFGDGIVETLDSDTYVSYYDDTDYLQGEYDEE